MSWTRARAASAAVSITAQWTGPDATHRADRCLGGVGSLGYPREPMTTRARTLAMAIVMAGCGGHSATPGPPDGMAMLAVTDPDGDSLTSIEIPLTLVGQAASVGVVVHNTGTAETGAISVSIDGANAGDLALDDPRTTCAATSLAPGAICTVELVFHAAADGERTATLTIASPAGGTLQLAITAHGGAPDLLLDPMITFSNVEVDVGALVSVALRNAGSVLAPVDAITVSSTGFSAGVFSLSATSCGAALAPESMCTIDVMASPHDMAPVPFAGTLTVASNGVDHSMALTARGAHRIKIVKAGTASGTVTLTEAGVAHPMSFSCGDTCNLLTPEAILLTQNPDPDAEFLGWSLPDSGAGDCGTNPTCTVGKELTATTVTATWAPAGSTQLHIAIVGGSGGLRIVSGGVTTTCVEECTTSVSPGPVMLTVEGTAPAIGFSGACTSSGTQCTYTQGAGRSDVTVTLDNPNAVWTYLPGNGTDVRSAAFDGSGDLIITTGAGITKLSPQGAPIWTQPIAASAVATGPGDTVYAIAGASLIKLDPAGAMLWSAPWANGCAGGDAPSFNRCLAVSPTGAVAINSGGVVARWESDGTASWTRTGSSGGVGFDAAGDVVIPTHQAIFEAPLDAQPYAPDGTQLPLIPNIAPVSAHYALACDSGGTLQVVATGTTSGFVGIAVAGPGQVETARFFSMAGGGWDVGSVSLPFSTGLFAANMALSTTGRLAVVGTFMLSPDSIYRGGWVQIYGP